MSFCFAKYVDAINPAQLPRQDMVDTFNFFRNYLDNKL